MDSREIRERGQFGSRRNIGKPKIFTKDVKRLLGISTTKRVSEDRRLKPEAEKEFQTTLEKLEKLRRHDKYTYATDVRDAVKYEKRRLGFKMKATQERRLNNLLFASEDTSASAKPESSHLVRLHAALESDAPDQPYKPPSRDNEEVPKNTIEKIRQKREQRFERHQKKENKDEPPTNIPLAA